MAHLGKVFADILGGGTEVVAKGTSIASLASALTEELARNVRRVYHDLSQPGTRDGDGEFWGSCATYSAGFGVHRSGGWAPKGSSGLRWQRRGCRYGRDEIRASWSRVAMS